MTGSGWQRDIRWRSLETGAVEHAHVASSETGITVTSTLSGGEPGPVSYTLHLTPHWVFRRIEITRSEAPAINLSRSESGDWSVNGAQRPDLAPCIDIDLSISPLTNTLPINRHSLDIGQPVRFSMAYIRVETGEVFRDDQIYTALDSSGRYRYQAADRTFEAELVVDSGGFVLSYPHLFEQLREAQ